MTATYTQLAGNKSLVIQYTNYAYNLWVIN